MTTAADIQKQLEELWENAEQVAPQEGDTFVGKIPDHPNYSIGVARWPLNPEQYRVIERAKPKRPQYVVAGMLYAGDDDKREPFIEREDGYWESATAYGPAGDLIDPVPLVEMPEREALARAIATGLQEQPGNFHLTPADAVLELLRGER